MIYGESRKLDEKITSMNENNEIMSIKLKHGEEFHRSFKAVMDASRTEREEQVMTLESYKEKIFEDLLQAKKEMRTALEEQKLEMTKIRYSVNTQRGYNQQTEGNFDLYQNQVVNAVTEAKKASQEQEYILQRILHESREMQNKKMFKFCDIMVREF